MNRTALLVAFHFPPIGYSSGAQRTLKLAQHLTRVGWKPLVLSINPRAYEATAEDEGTGDPDGVVVHRALGFDSARHLSIRGRYFSWTALPDRFVTWVPAAVLAGLRMVRKYRPAVLWSTSPIPSAHLVARVLHRITGLPWVADFRDPMTEEGYPSDPAQWRMCRRLEQGIVRHASRLVFVAPGVMREYRARYPAVPEQRWRLIPNGYDERDFDGLAPQPDHAVSDDVSERPFVLLHSGFIYASERDPSQFFEALSTLRKSGVLTPRNFELRLRACGREDQIGDLLMSLGIDDIVRIEPRISHVEAINEMQQVSAQLVLQSASCNGQIPAKLYEYLRVGKPVLGLTDAAGDTAGLMREAGLDAIHPLDDSAAIIDALPRFMEAVRLAEAPLPDPAVAQRYSRAAMSEAIVGLFEELVGHATPETAAERTSSVES